MFIFLHNAINTTINSHRPGHNNTIALNQVRNLDRSRDAIKLKLDRFLQPL